MWPISIPRSPPATSWRRASPREGAPKKRSSTSRKRAASVAVRDGSLLSHRDSAPGCRTPSAPSACGWPRRSVTPPASYRPAGSGAGTPGTPYGLPPVPFIPLASACQRAAAPWPNTARRAAAEAGRAAEAAADHIGSAIAPASGQGPALDQELVSPRGKSCSVTPASMAARAHEALNGNGKVARASDAPAPPAAHLPPMPPMRFMAKPQPPPPGSLANAIFAPAPSYEGMATTPSYLPAPGSYVPAELAPSVPLTVVGSTSSNLRVMEPARTVPSGLQVRCHGGIIVSRAVWAT